MSGRPNKALPMSLSPGIALSSRVFCETRKKKKGSLSEDRNFSLHLSSYYTWTERNDFVKPRKASLLVERVAEVVGVEAPSGRRGGAGGGSCNQNEPPAARAPGGGRRGGRLLGPVAAEGNGLRRERGAGDEDRSTSRRSRHAHESRVKSRPAARPRPQVPCPAEGRRPRRKPPKRSRTEAQGIEKEVSW